MKPELVIFDCDGVLVDSEVISNQVMEDNLAGYGLKLTLKECMDLFVGGTIFGVMEKSKALGATLPDDWVAEIYAQTNARLAQGVAPVKGIVAVLDLLDAAGIKYCVASNGARSKMQTTLGQNDMWERFENAMFSAHELGVAKPDPDLFQIAAGDVPPEKCVVVEDSVNGARAAAAANMRCLGYHEHDDGKNLAAEGAELIDDMAKLPGLIGL